MESAIKLFSDVLHRVRDADPYWFSMYGEDSRFTPLASLFGCTDQKHFIAFLVLCGFASKSGKSKSGFTFRRTIFCDYLKSQTGSGRVEFNVKKYDRANRIMFLRIGRHLSTKQKPKNNKKRKKSYPKETASTTTEQDLASPEEQSRWRFTGLLTKQDRLFFYQRMCELVSPITPAQKEGEASTTAVPADEEDEQQDQTTGMGIATGASTSTPTEEVETTPSRNTTTASDYNTQYSSTPTHARGEEAVGDVKDTELIIDFIREQFICKVFLNPEEIEWHRDLDTRQIEESILEVAGRILSSRAEQIDRIVGTANKVSISPASKVTADTKYSFLTEYQVPKESIRVLDGMLKDIFNINFYYKKTSTLCLELGNNITTKLVLIPQSSSVERMRKNNHRHKWLENLLQALSPNNNPAATLKEVLTFLVTSSNDQYRQAFIDTVEEHGLSITPRIDEASTFAIQSQANLSYKQMRELRRNLHVVTGSYIFAPEYKLKRLADAFVEPVVGEYTHGRERIHWSCRKVDDLTIYSVQQMLQVQRQAEMTAMSSSSTSSTTNSSIKQSSNMKVCDIVVSIDHGKGYSRATLLVVMRYQQGDCVQDDREMMALANAKCRKDNYHILQQTFAPMIDAGLQRLKQCKFLYTYVQDGTGDVKVTLLPPEVMETTGSNDPGFKFIRSIPLEIWIAGDSLFFAIALGKEGSSTFWCTYCNLFREHWRKKLHAKGNQWTLAKITSHLEALEVGMQDSGATTTSGRKKTKKATPQVRKGFKESVQPLFKSVEVDHYVVTVLHLQLGMVNTVYEHLMTEIQYSCELYDSKYRVAEQKLFEATRTFELQQRELAEYESTTVSTEQDIKREIRRISRSLLVRPEDRQQLNSLQHELDSIKQDRDSLTKARDVARDIRANCQSKFDREAAKDINSKSKAQPVRAMIEDILAQRYGIDKGAYHGGDIQGPGCRRLMGKSESICNDIQDALVALPVQQKRLSDTEICSIVERHESLLSLMDGMFSLLRTSRFRITDKDVQTAVEYRSKVLELWRHLGLSVTPKVHVLEDHAVELLARHRGYGDIGEDFGERAHQIESRNDKRVEAVVSQKVRESSKCKDEALGMLAAVRTVVLKVDENSKRKFNKKKQQEQSAAVNDCDDFPFSRMERAKRQRQEYRESVLEVHESVGESVLPSIQDRLELHKNNSQE